MTFFSWQICLATRQHRSLIWSISQDAWLCSSSKCMRFVAFFFSKSWWIAIKFESNLLSFHVLRPREFSSKRSFSEPNDGNTVRWLSCLAIGGTTTEKVIFFGGFMELWKIRSLFLSLIWLWLWYDILTMQIIDAQWCSDIIRIFHFWDVWTSRQGVFVHTSYTPPVKWSCRKPLEDPDR